MKETNIKNAERALTITTTLTLFVAGFEVLMAYLNFKPGMNFLDIASYANANIRIYCLILILINLILLPGAVMLFRQNGISLKKEITEKKTLGKDILYGIAALSVTTLFSLVYTLILSGRTELAYTNHDISAETTIIKIIALTFVSGICKEIYFRGLAKKFCGPVLGETQALLLFNIMFAMLDWYNMGFSFVAGLVWIFVYKKTGHLLPGMIAHGGANLIATIYVILTSGVV